MKNTVSIVLILTLALAACRDRAAEKRIAELESRISQLEGTKANQPTQNPAAPSPTSPAEPEKMPEGPLPVISFNTTDHDFGTINEGQKVVFTYQVTNTGKAPLIIQNAQPSCGCTVPDWTKTPIAVGGTGFVKAEFDSHGKTGVQNKTITVTANTWPKTSTLKFKAMVVAKATGANGPAAN
ncbi:MAG: hypothetical protein OJF59_000882 [Cytophagales bacterium]|nr:DUF1573 domain-containing protein [Bacteroidota bacterium]MBS1979843.1 DUF1573 domain-containing protein [Bacteroidota bacterium]WHZ07129.1 MAG: hypothetical protein OJF59_000882 [Cytophagales bacterium]